MEHQPHVKGQRNDLLANWPRCLDRAKDANTTASLSMHTLEHNLTDGQQRSETCTQHIDKHKQKTQTQPNTHTNTLSHPRTHMHPPARPQT